MSSFASTDDIAARRGRDLTAAETTAADLLLEGATALIAQACDKDDAWAATLSSPPKPLRFTCIEMVMRAMANPDGLAAMQEQLGTYQYNLTFRDYENAGLWLTRHERSTVRRAVFGTPNISPRTPPIEDGLWPEQIDKFFIGS